MNETAHDISAATKLANLDAQPGCRYARTDNEFGLRGMDHVALETLDIELMARFIAEALGGKPYYYAGFDAADQAAGRVKHIFLRVGGVLLQCAEPKNGKVSLRKDDPNVSPHWAFTVSAADLDNNIARLRRLGIPVTDPIHHRGVDITSAYFQSPEGHKLEICTWESYPLEKTREMRIDWPSLAHNWPHGRSR
jgi:catechol 2,3-dioxygenase-like lactoylglutathione lyase family enzyme